MLETYIGTKIIQAEPQTCQKDDHNSKIGDPGYKVVYKDGYVSWSPKDVFEEANRKMDEMSFGLAIEAVKKGLKVSFSDWSDKGAYLSIEDNNLVITTSNHSNPSWYPVQNEILSDKWQIWKES